MGCFLKPLLELLSFSLLGWECQAAKAPLAQARHQGLKAFHGGEWVGPAYEALGNGSLHLIIELQCLEQGLCSPLDGR